MKHLLALLILTTILFTSCNETKTTETTTPVVTEEILTSVFLEPTSELNITYNTLKKGVDTSWASLNKIEEDKFFAMKRLLDEVSYNPRHKAKRIKEELAKIETLKKAKLKQGDLVDLTNMDNYDVKSDELISSLHNLVDETENMENYPLAKDLLNDLDSLNTTATMSIRGLYGDAVLNYNKFISTNEAKLKENGVSNTQKIPGLFDE